MDSKTVTVVGAAGFLFLSAIGAAGLVKGGRVSVRAQLETGQQAFVNVQIHSWSGALITGLWVASFVCCVGGVVCNVCKRFENL